MRENDVERKTSLFARLTQFIAVADYFTCTLLCNAPPLGQQRIQDPEEFI